MLYKDLSTYLEEDGPLTDEVLDQIDKTSFPATELSGINDAIGLANALKAAGFMPADDRPTNRKRGAIAEIIYKQAAAKNVIGGAVAQQATTTSASGSSEIAQLAAALTGQATCPNCHALINPGDLYCGSCETSLTGEMRVCPVDGAQVKNNKTGKCTQHRGVFLVEEDEFLLVRQWLNTRGGAVNDAVLAIRQPENRSAMKAELSQQRGGGSFGTRGFLG